MSVCVCTLLNTYWPGQKQFSDFFPKVRETVMKYCHVPRFTKETEKGIRTAV